MPKQRRLLVVVVGFVAAALAAGAYAYWTASGTGSGTATVGTDSGVTITNVSPTGSLYPSGSVSVDFDVTNNSSTAPVKVGKVVVDTTFGSGTGFTGLASGCDPAWFSFPDVTVNSEIAASATQSFSGTLSMSDPGVNQDSCKSSSFTLHLKTDNSGI